MTLSPLRTFAFFCCFVLASIECAADRSMSVNFSATSPGGGFKADATLASTRHRIAMRAMPSGDLLWSAEAETFLDELSLTDAGELLTRSDSLGFVLYTAAGKPGPSFSLGSEIASDERERFCGQGYRWERQIFNYLVRNFWNEGARSWIYFRTYWGRIVTVDRANGALDRDPALAKRIEDSLLRETESWIASAPAMLRGTPSTLCPYLEDKVAVHLFVIRAHRLKSGERYIAAAMKELRGEQIGNLEYCLDRVYDPNALAKRLNRGAPMAVVLLLFAMLTGIYGYLLRGTIGKRTRVSA